MREKEWDRLLNISTAGRYDKLADDFIYPYEPTPYSVLERLLDSGLITRDNTLIDYGSGKGRASLFLAKTTGCRAVGVEFSRLLHDAAAKNLASSSLKNRVSFVLQRAEWYIPPAAADRCYFFNPFSEELLRRVLVNLVDSFYDFPREILLFFYYPSAEYIEVIRDFPEITFLDEIPCEDLFRQKDGRERILIFGIR